LVCSGRSRRQTPIREFIDLRAPDLDQLVAVDWMPFARHLSFNRVNVPAAA
jgi:hypothetical protein